MDINKPIENFQLLEQLESDDIAMFFFRKEQQVMKPLFEMINNSSTKKYEIVLEDETVLYAIFDTCYESDNGLEEDEEGYEEFFACLFLIQDIAFVREEYKGFYKENELLEITYHNYPKKIKHI